METAVNSLVTALTTSISTYTSYIGSGIVDIFKYLFFQLDSNGTIIGFNFLGYTAVILLGLGLVCLIITVFIHYCTLAYKVSIIPDEVLSDLMDEYDVNLHKQQMDEWRDLVYGLKDDYSSNDIRAQALANEMKKYL